MFEDLANNKEHYVNAPITIQELNDATASLNSKKSSVGLYILSNEMLKHLPEEKILYIIFFKNVGLMVTCRLCGINQ